MRLLYAASDRRGAHFQLNRFVQAAFGKHQIRTAAYEGKNYGCDIDWILDALYGIYDNRPNYSGVAMDIYRTQLQQYAPDLVISDCEPITTRLANDLGIPVWQVSPLLLYRAIVAGNIKQLALRTKYPSLFSGYNGLMKGLAKSDRFLVYSHLCDLNMPDKIEWVRPYAKVGDASPLYEHNLVVTSITNNKSLVHRMTQMDDAVLFSECRNERFPVSMGPISGPEYACSIRNAKQVIVYGCEDLVADAFYNGKFAWMLPDFTDAEVMMSSIFNEYLVLGKIVYNVGKEEIIPMPDIEYETNNAVKFLDEEL